MIRLRHLNKLLNYPDTAKFPSISGWAFNIEDEIIIVQSEVTAKMHLTWNQRVNFK